ARLELFGDEVESIREFDVETQRSVGPASSVALLPLSEYPVRREMLEKLAARVNAARPRLRIEPGEPFPGWEFLVPLIQPLTNSPLDLAPSAILFLDEPALLRREYERRWAL